MQGRYVRITALTRNPVPGLTTIGGGCDRPTGTDEQAVIGVAKDDFEKRAHNHDVAYAASRHQLIE